MLPIRGRVVDNAPLWIKAFETVEKLSLPGRAYDGVATEGMLNTPLAAARAFRPVVCGPKIVICILSHYWFWINIDKCSRNSFSMVEPNWSKTGLSWRHCKSHLEYC